VISPDRNDTMLPRPPATDGPRRSRWRRRLEVLREFAYDANRFAAHSAAMSPRRLASLRALVTMDTHRIEKGLAVPSPRPWFGKSIVTRLLTNTRLYLACGGDLEVCQSSIAAVSEYVSSHNTGPEPAPAWTRDVRVGLATLAANIGPSGPLGGTVTMSRDTTVKSSQLDSLDFFFTRHSIRQFDDDPVTWNEITRAVEAAQTTPSVCNRQSWSVHVYPRGKAADTVLAAQNGNAGFGHTASHILLITVDLRTFLYLGERNQGWIDGGMFAMSLVYAFHALGIGTCCLNWSVESRTDRRLRSVAAIPDHESVIMMMAIGRLPECLPVARSLRRPTAELVKPGRLRRNTDQADRLEPAIGPMTTQKGEQRCRATS
jgi:nitroreductase